MPNWVNNDLKITGPEAELERFLAECFSESESGPRLDFDRFIPMPAPIKEGVLRDNGAVIVGSEASFPDWYLWSIRNWGTKWNAQNTHFEHCSNVISLSFRTAWSIAWPIYEAIAERFPLLTIEGDILQEMREFGGRVCCYAGKIVFEDKTEEIMAEWVESCAKLDHERNEAVSVSDEDIPF